MYKIRLWLSLLIFGCFCPVWGQSMERLVDQEATFSARRSPSRADRPARVQTVKHGASSEPALPDSRTNPVPASVADRPQDTLLRRRKLRVRFRA